MYRDMTYRDILPFGRAAGRPGGSEAPRVTAGRRPGAVPRARSTRAGGTGAWGAA